MGSKARKSHASIYAVLYPSTPRVNLSVNCKDNGANWFSQRRPGAYNRDTSQPTELTARPYRLLLNDADELVNGRQ